MESPGIPLFSLLPDVSLALHPFLVAGGQALVDDFQPGLHFFHLPGGLQVVFQRRFFTNMLGGWLPFFDGHTLPGPGGMGTAHTVQPLLFSLGHLVRPLFR